jgi:protein-ribulosamine 3-kinase
VCDPAVYYGEREMEIAYMELFEGFGPLVFAAYREAYPLEPGYAERRPLHQLYHLLNHLNHFGGSYGNEVDQACVRIAGSFHGAA